MSHVDIKDASNVTKAIDTFVRNEGGTDVETQATAIVNPSTGDPLLAHKKSSCRRMIMSSSAPRTSKRYCG